MTALAGALSASLGCASASPPPGGPEDVAPPKVVRVTPDSNAVNVGDQHVSFYFDETINDRGSGAQEVGNFFLVSPSDGSPRVSWHRSRIDVRPRDGFRANTAYTVSLLPGLSDLRNNLMRTGATIVFSTGPTIPKERITGVVFDWAAERVAPRAFVQAITPDSTTYLSQSDSAGLFTVGPLPAGRYLVRAIIDQNGNRALDRNEPFDSVTVTVPQPQPVELRTAVRDTLPPRLLSVTASDSVTVRVTFDRAIDPAQTLGITDFQLVASDSTVVPIASVLTPRQEAAAAQAAQQRSADSLRRADSLAGRALPPRSIVPPAPAGVVARATPSVPAPYTTLLIRPARPLRPGATYRLTVSGARGLSGRTQSSDRSFTVTRPPVPAAADSSRVSPPARPTTSPPHRD